MNFGVDLESGCWAWYECCQQNAVGVGYLATSLAGAATCGTPPKRKREVSRVVDVASGRTNKCKYLPRREYRIHSPRSAFIPRYTIVMAPHLCQGCRRDDFKSEKGLKRHIRSCPAYTEYVEGIITRKRAWDEENTADQAAKRARVGQHEDGGDKGEGSSQQVVRDVDVSTHTLRMDAQAHLFSIQRTICL